MATGVSCDPVGDVAHREDRGHRRLRPVVDAGPHRSAPSLTPSGSSPRPAVLGRRPVAKSTWSTTWVSPLSTLTLRPPSTFSIRGDVALDLERDPARAHGAGDVVAQVLVEAAQDLVAAVELDHVGAEAVHDAGELAGDIAAADDEHALRLGLEVEDLVRGDAELGAGDRRHARAGRRWRREGGCAVVFRAGREAHPVRVEDRRRGRRRAAPRRGAGGRGRPPRAARSRRPWRRRSARPVEARLLHASSRSRAASSKASAKAEA